MERGEGYKHDQSAGSLIVCAYAASAHSGDHCSQSSGEEHTLWSLTALVHKLGSATYQRPWINVLTSLPLSFSISKMEIILVPT